MDSPGGILGFSSSGSPGPWRLALGLVQLQADAGVLQAQGPGFMGRGIGGFTSRSIPSDYRRMLPPRDPVIREHRIILIRLRVVSLRLTYTIIQVKDNSPGGFVVLPPPFLFLPQPTLQAPDFLFQGEKPIGIPAFL